jgi:hypothetical protein
MPDRNLVDCTAMRAAMGSVGVGVPRLDHASTMAQPVW